MDFMILTNDEGFVKNFEENVGEISGVEKVEKGDPSKLGDKTFVSEINVACTDVVALLMYAEKCSKGLNALTTVYDDAEKPLYTVGEGFHAEE